MSTLVPPLPADPAVEVSPAYSRPFTPVPAWVWLSLILIAGFLLRNRDLQERSLWYDEALSWRLASTPAGQIPQMLKASQHPPLYFLLLRAWVAVFGDSASAMRLLSAVVSLAAVPGLYLFVRDLLRGPLAGSVRWAGEPGTAALLAAALVGLSPLQARYGGEARMYALGAALATFSAWALVRALSTQTPLWRRWLLFGGINLLFVYTHNFATLTVAAEGLFLLWWLWAPVGGKPWRMVHQPHFWPALVALALPVAGVLLWLPVLRAQVSNTASRVWIPPLSDKSQVLALACQLFVDPDTWPSRPASWRMTFLLAGFLAATAWRNRPADWLVLSLALAPVGLTILACRLGVQVFIARYFIFAQPFMLAAVAMTMGRLRAPALLGLAAAVLLTASAWACADAHQRRGVDPANGYQGASNYIAQHRKPGEPILTADPFAFLPIWHHSPDRSDIYICRAAPRSQVAAEWALPDGVILERGWVDRRWEKVWVVHHVSTVPVMTNWREVSRATFRDVSSPQAIQVVAYVPSGR